MSIPPTNFWAGGLTPKPACSARRLFLLQRGLAAGITIYAPAIILSTVLGWRLDLTIILSGLLVIIYTVTGGSEAVSLTQKYQMAVIFGGMVTAFVILLAKLPASLSDALHRGGRLQKTERGEFFARPPPALHVLVRPAGRTVSVAVLFRHRPIAGAALSSPARRCAKAGWG